MAAQVAPSPSITDARREVLERTAQSPTFQRCPKLRELLLHIGDRALDNHPEELREQQIGCAVFGRRSDYSPAEDNIVRVEMRQLRKRLAEHFAAAGKEEQLTIVIPKGTYVPVFEPREIVAVVDPLAHDEPDAPPRLGRWQWIAIAQGALILVLGAACVWLMGSASSSKPAAVFGQPDRGPMWPLVFSKDEPTTIVCADSGLVVARTVKRRPITLEEYVAGDYIGKSEVSPEASNLLTSIPRWAFTDIADVRLVQRIYRINSGFWDRTNVRTARTMQVQDFKSGNVVLLGSVRSNPWNHLFEAALNFQFEYDEGTRQAYIRNKSPQPGEQEKYWGSALGSASGEAYSVIALVPNLRNNGNVLIIAGTSGEATEATGEFLTSAVSAQLTPRLLAGGRKKFPYFQALLRSGTLAGVAKSAEVVALRVLPGDVVVK